VIGADDGPGVGRLALAGAGIGRTARTGAAAGSTRGTGPGAGAGDGPGRGGILGAAPGGGPSTPMPSVCAAASAAAFLRSSSIVSLMASCSCTDSVS
jgi:hypothetical protein